ncbi:hypothetical protein [Planotetraspora sp. GP83]|uniref:hypothetical protein n=1 Tax=Planotetraspora sp. GP83 TaxID=3156264 RepID=UPI0035166DF4
MKVVTATDGHSRIAIPVTWSRMKISDDDVLDVGSDQYVEYLDVASEDKRPYAWDLGAYAKNMINFLSKAFDRVRVSKPRRVTIGGMPGVQYDFQGEVDEGRVAMLFTFVEGAEHYHRISTTTPASRAAANSRRLRAIVATFRETGR